MHLHRKHEQQRIIDTAQELIDCDYPSKETIDVLMRTQYFRLSWVTDGFSTLQGKKVLDIGCGAKTLRGSPDSEKRSDPHLSEAWFARFAAAYGADVTGVDRRKSQGENYTHIVLDLTKPGALDIFDDESFDIINSSAFLVAPKKEATDSLGIAVTTPELLDRYDDEGLNHLDQQITEQAIRKLKEGGIYMYNEQIYQKQHGKLHPVPWATLIAEQGFPISPHRGR